MESTIGQYSKQPSQVWVGDYTTNPPPHTPSSPTLSPNSEQWLRSAQIGPPHALPSLHPMPWHIAHPTSVLLCGRTASAGTLFKVACQLALK
ncbi:hypothetical protein SUGI_0414990 [Cryptomeria japonica]|nr:hypothetical protein SUGI_0414990 [Cryptomeria japonica]